MVEKIIVYTDGGSRGNPGPSGAGVVILNEKGDILKKVAKPLGINTNNIAEYEAVLIGFQALKKLFGKGTINMEFEFRMDSQLVQKQLSGEYKIKKESLFPQFMKIWNIKIKNFPKVTFLHIPREENDLADSLANEAMDSKKSLRLDV